MTFASACWKGAGAFSFAGACAFKLLPAKLAIVRTGNLPKKLKVGRSDKGYGRDNHKHLTADQVPGLIKAAKANRDSARDALMIALAHVTPCGHSNSCLIDLKGGTINIRRTKAAWAATSHLLLRTDAR